jgi:hypothetical protein
MTSLFNCRLSPSGLCGAVRFAPGAQGIGVEQPVGHFPPRRFGPLTAIADIVEIRVCGIARAFIGTLKIEIGGG